MESLQEKIIQELNEFRGRFGIAIEIEDGENIRINSGDVFRSASLIKLPILLSCLISSKNGNMDLDQKITITESSKVGGSGVLQALSSNLSITIKDLMTLMITVSDNTATNIMIDLLGKDEINASFKSIGLTKTILNRKMMDFAAVERGKDNFTSPNEMIFCLKLLNGLNNTIGSEEVLTARDILKSQQFRDKLPAMMDQETITILNKTGELPNVEHDCAIIESKARKVYVAILMDQLTNPYAAKQTICRIGKHLSDFFKK